MGVPWLGATCGRRRYCRSGRENLCVAPRFTGYDVDGGYAEYAVAQERFCFALPEGYSDAEAAPLLCAGLIGHRALRLAGDPARVGLYGFGAAALVAQAARHEGRSVTPSHGPATSPGRPLPGRWAPRGPAAPTRCRRSRWTPR